MTREEFLESIDGIVGGLDTDDAYEFGRLYDDMTKPHWVNVEDYATDELPPLINEKDPNGESVQVLFVLVLDGVQYINKGTFDYDSGVWHSLDMQCSFCKENVTHWIPLPTLPKKGE